MLQNLLSTEPLSELEKNPDTLALLQFGNSKVAGLTNLHIAELPDAASLELWQSAAGPVEEGMAYGCQWRRDRHFQFTSVSLPLANKQDYEVVARTAYERLLDTIGESSASNLVRFWNYVPHINDGDGDDENYKRFCTGRLQAFNKHNIQELEFPAASAVGHHQNGLTICALSSSAKAMHHANPRQVDAFAYPREYGPSSPSFARATTLSIDATRYCFISGTASILGHRTVHEGDLALQLYTTNDNIRYLLEETGFALEQIQTLRVYLRDASLIDECKRIVEQSYPACQMVLAEADICRRELLVEIEAFCAAPAS